MNCPKCGKKITKSANFCKACGEKIIGDQPIDEAASKICAQCGTKGSAEAKFCKACGAPFSMRDLNPKAETDIGVILQENFSPAVQLTEPAKPSGKVSEMTPKQQTNISETPPSLNSSPSTSPSPIGSSNKKIPTAKDTAPKKQAAVKKQKQNKPIEKPVSATSPASKNSAKVKSGGLLKGIAALGITSVLLVQCVPRIFPGILPQSPKKSTSAGQVEPGEKSYSDNPFSGVTFTEKELKVTGESMTVSPEVTQVTAAGVTVDFGPYNLMAETKLEVAKLPVKQDKMAGVEFTTYNLTLNGMAPEAEFTTMVDITLPYDPEGISEANEETAFSAGWFDEASGNWVLLPSTIDAEANTITFQTTHFSPKAVLKNTLNQGTKLFYYEGGRYDGPNTKVLVDTGALMSELRKLESNAFDQLIRDRSVPTNEMVSTGLGLTNILTSGVDYAGSLQDTLLPALHPVASSLKNKLLVVGTAATFLKVMDQYGRGVDSYKILRDNVFDALEILVSGAAIIYGSPFLVMVGAGIWAVGVYDQAAYDPEDITSYQNRLEEVYDQFTRRQAVYNLRTGEARYIAAVPGQKTGLAADEIMLNSKAAWALAVKSIYLQSKGEPQMIQERVQQLVRSISGLFWTLYRSDSGILYHWIDEESGLLPASAIARLDLPWPAPEDTNAFIKKMIGREVIRTHDYLQDIYDEMSEFEIAELRTQYLKSVLDLAEEYNRTMTFELVDETLKKPGFAKSPLAAKTFNFDVSGSLSPDFKISARPEDSNQVFTCNVYHYVMAGMPTQIHMYPFDGDFAVRDAEFNFEPEFPVTRISLQGVPQVEVGVLEIDGPKVRSYEGHNSESGGVKVDFDIYYRDGFPEGSKITFEFGAGDTLYSGDPQYGEKLPDGRWLMRINQDYLVDGTYHPVFQMLDAQGNVLGEDSITINISGLWDGTYLNNPAIPPGDPDAGTE